MLDETDKAMITPEAFKRWRIGLGLSQAGAGALLGVAQRTVSGWEMGQSRIPLAIGYAIKWLSETQRREVTGSSWWEMS